MGVVQKEGPECADGSAGEGCAHVLVERACSALGEGRTPVRLEALLRESFQDNRVRGLRRPVSMAPGEHALDAWRMLSMLPFYTPPADARAPADAARAPVFPRLVLPILIKRYSYHEGLFTSGSRRNDRPVLLSTDVRQCAPPRGQRARAHARVLITLGPGPRVASRRFAVPDQL